MRVKSIEILNILNFFTIVLKLTPPNLQLLKMRFIWLNEQMNAAIIETVLSYIYDNNLLY